MAKRKKKKNSMLKYYYIMGALLILAVILLAIYFSEENQMNRSMKQEGYTTEESEDPFYKKITTGNTLDDYYNSLAMNKDSAYEEYYLQKDSYMFLEQKLVYQNEATTALNISSDLRNLSTTFNYELSYKEAYLLMEGDSSENSNCKIIIKKNITQESIQNACNQVQNELDTFFLRRAELLKNEKVQELIKNAPAVVANNNDKD